MKKSDRIRVDPGAAFVLMSFDACASAPTAAKAAAYALSIAAALGAINLSGCAGEPPAGKPVLAPLEARESIERALPRTLRDRSAWSDDIFAAFNVLTITPSRENICAVVAVIQQESGFEVDPVVAGLGAIARKEIYRRAGQAHVPQMLVDGVLNIKSVDGRTYRQRIDAARTEKQLSDVYEDFIASVPLGKTLFSERNPIRTRGPMQVNVAFAEQFAAAAPYPYPVQSIPDELFTRRGSLYFGIAHLLDYRAPYDGYLYRFADYNAGQFASRNAAFQAAIRAASGIALIPDGALLPHDSGAEPGATETALRALGARLRLSDNSIHSALAEGKTHDFESTTLYRRVFALAAEALGHAPPPAVVPRIKLGGPKIERTLSTDWYAHRVYGRYQRCLSAA